MLPKDTCFVYGLRMSLHGHLQRKKMTSNEILAKAEKLLKQEKEHDGAGNQIQGGGERRGGKKKAKHVFSSGP